MSEWDEVEVGDLCRIKHGHAFKGEFFEDDGCFLVLSPGNFLATGGLQLRDGKETFYSGEFSNEYLLEEGDLVIAMTDLKQEAPILGSVLRIPESGRFLHNQRLGLVQDIADEVDPDFLYGPSRIRGIEGCWHRLGSLCHEDAAGFEVAWVGEAVGAASQDL